MCHNIVLPLLSYFFTIFYNMLLIEMRQEVKSIDSSPRISNKRDLYGLS